MPAKPRPFRLAAPVTPEDDIHLSIRKALDVFIAPPGVASDAGVVWFTIEHRNAASVMEGAARKGRGVVAGVPDIIVHCPIGRAVYLEVKAHKGVLSPAQKTLHAALAKAWVSVTVVYSVDDAIAALRAQGVPMRGGVLHERTALDGTRAVRIARGLGS